MELPWSHSPCNYASLTISWLRGRSLAHAHAYQLCRIPVVWVVIACFYWYFLTFTGWPSRHTPVHHPLIKQSLKAPAGSAPSRKMNPITLHRSKTATKLIIIIFRWKWLGKEPLCIIEHRGKSNPSVHWKMAPFKRNYTTHKLPPS